MLKARSRRLWQLVFPLICLTPAYGHAETLQQALATAYQNNPELESERTHLRAVDEQVPEALANWHPSATAQTEAGFSHQTYDNTSGSLKPVDASVSLAQPLYRGGRTQAATREAKEIVYQERARLMATEQDVFTRGTTL